MPIRFTCSHCGRSLTVRDELAGKRGRCPYCKQIVMVPASRAVAPVRDPKKPDVESLALAALGLTTGETVAASETVSTSPKPVEPIKVTCNWCDHEFEVAGTLAGKQTPCPECRRIVRVPTLQVQSLRDWRQVARGPTAAAMHQPRLEGEWGTATARSYVSAEALEEAEVLPVEREPLTPGQWATRIGLAFLALAGAYLSYRWYSSHQAEKQTASLFDEAKAFLNNPQPAPSQAAYVRLALAQYWQNVEPDNNRVRGISRNARRLAAEALQEIHKQLSQRDQAAWECAQELIAEYLAQCCTLGLLPEDIQLGIEILYRFSNRREIARQVVWCIARKAETPEKQAAALERFCRHLALADMARSASSRRSQSTQEASASEQDALGSLVLVAATECATLGATEVAKKFLEQVPPQEQRDKIQRAAPAPVVASCHQVLRHLVGQEGQGIANRQPAEQIECLARTGQLEQAWVLYQKLQATNSLLAERWACFRLLAELALVRGSQEMLDNLHRELDQKLGPVLPPHWANEALSMRVRLATAAGKDNELKEILQRVGQGELRRAVLRAQAETLLLRSQGYLPPESFAFLSELSPAERACLLHRLAWHNVRKDPCKTRDWLSSLAGPDRAIVAAVVLAHQSAQK